MYLIRLLIVGDSGVGKTSILTRFYEGTFILNQKTTVGVDYRAKQITLDGEPVKLQVWDTAGQERFRSMTSAFYNKAQGVILVFDVGSAESFKSVPSWLRDIRRDAPSDCEVVLCANKTDRPLDTWQVSREEFTVFSQEHNLNILESSACTGDNVDNIFSFLAKEVLLHERSQLMQMNDADSEENLVVFDLPKKKKKADCCALM